MKKIVFTVMLLTCLLTQVFASTKNVFALVVPGTAVHQYGGGFLNLQSATNNIKAMQDLGIKTVMPDMAVNPNTLLPDILKASDALNMQVAPRLDVSGLSRVKQLDSGTVEQMAIKALDDYYALAKNYKSPYHMPNGSLLMYVYDEGQLTNDEWQYVESQCTIDGCNYYFIGTYGTGTWDANAYFKPGISGSIATVMPQYTRVQLNGKPLPLDATPDKGVRYTAQWQQVLNLNVDWVLIVSWNDIGGKKVSDGTGIANNKIYVAITKKYIFLFLSN